MQTRALAYEEKVVYYGVSITRKFSKRTNHTKRMVRTSRTAVFYFFNSSQC